MNTLIKILDEILSDENMHETLTNIAFEDIWHLHFSIGIYILSIFLIIEKTLKNFQLFIIPMK